MALHLKGYIATHFLNLRKCYPAGPAFMPFFLVFGIAAMIASTVPAFGHLLGQGVVFLDIQPDRINGHVDLLMTDANDVVFDGQVNDGILTTDELKDRIDSLEAYLQKRVTLRSPSGDLKIRYTGHEIREAPQVTYPFVQMFFTVDKYPANTATLEVQYSALFDKRPHHQGLLVIDSNINTGFRNETEAISLVFTRLRQVQTLNLNQDPEQNLLAKYLQLGTDHLLTGYDHLLFLAALLLTAPLGRGGTGRSARRSVQDAALIIAAILLTFLTAHGLAMTFEAYVMELLPVRFVQPLIALTVIAVAVRNLFPTIGRLTFALVLPLAALHGLGYADIVWSTGVPVFSHQQLLLGFNLGIALGLLIIAGLIFPGLYIVCQGKNYATLVVPAGSTAIACVGGFMLFAQFIGVTT